MLRQLSGRIFRRRTFGICRGALLIGRLRSRVGAWYEVTFRSFEDRNIRLLWLATALNFAGVSMNMTAQGVVAFNLTGDNRSVGTVMLGAGFASLLIAPVGGALADRVSKRAMLLSCQVALGSSFVFLGFSISAGFVNIPILTASAFINGMMFSMIRSVRNAFLGELAAPEMRGNAVALQQMAGTIMQIAGPFMAALLLGWSVTGAAGTYYLMTVAFCAAILMVVQLPSGRSAARDESSTNLLEDAVAGFRYSWSNPQIRWVMGGFFLLTLVGQPYITLMPGYTSDVLGVSTSRLGVLLAISAIGGFLISLAAASLADSPKAIPMLGVCNLLFAFSLIGLAFAPNFSTAAVIVLFLGAGASGFQVLNLSIALRTAEAAYMGRVVSMTMMASALNGFAALPIGILADHYGLREVLFFMGCGVFLVAVVLNLWRSRTPAVAGPHAA